MSSVSTIAAHAPRWTGYPTPNSAADPAVSPERAAWEAAVNNPTRKIGFNFALAYVFLRFSMLHESFAILTGLNSYAVILTLIPAVALTLITGGIQRTWGYRGAKFWIGFWIFFTMAVPFSSWISESAFALGVYTRYDLPMLFMLGGMVLTWNECKKVLSALAVSAVASLAMERMFAADSAGGRFAMEQGTIANSNDYAAHLILLLPFLLWAAITPGSKFLRTASLGLLVFGLFVTLKTGSRGGLIGLSIGFLLLVIKGRGGMRWGIAFGALAAVLIILVTLPPTLRARYAGTLSGTPDSGAEDVTGAGESRQARMYLLETSLRFTLEHPLFGVGPGNFSSAEGGDSRAGGRHGQWQETHNAYTQISSEVGIPAIFCYLGAILCSFLSFNRVTKTARLRKIPVLEATGLCCQLSLIMISTALIFLSLGYKFYLPALTGLSIAIERAMRMEFLSQPAAVATQAFWQAMPKKLQPRNGAVART